MPGPVYLVPVENIQEGAKIECLHITEKRSNENSSHGVSVHMFYVPYEELMGLPEVDADTLRNELLKWNADPDQVRMLTSNL